MAGEAYQVDYIINLRDNATAGITKFSQAASRLTKAAENLSAFQKQFNQISASFNKQLKLSVDTQRAHKSLDKILSKIRTIKKEAASVNLGVSGSVSGSSQKTRTVAAPSSRQTVSNNQSGLRQIVAPRGNKPLIPRNLEYQVLGPTRLGNVAMFDMFKGMGIAYGISAIGSGVRDIISQSTEYQNVMQTAKNILKANYKGGNFDKNFIDVERIAREVGVETKFTATEVADAVKFLAMAGLDMEAIKKSVRPIADIALIGDNDLGTTADVMTNIMTAYGIKPDEMRKTADVMTRTFTMSNTTLMELAESFKMAGSVLKLKNVPFETAAAAFGVLGDAGIKGTMAGTTMRTLMNNIVNPTKNQLKYWDILGVRRFDEYGNLRDINQIFGELNKLNVSDERSKEAQKRYEELQKKYKLDELQEGSDEYNKALAAYDKESEAIRRQYGGVDVFRLFRLTAAAGGGVLMNGVEKWNKIIEENFMSEGLSNELAEKKKGTIAGMWAQLTSAFQEGGLKVFEENDSKFRGYLQKGIGWFKSDQFTHVLRGVIDLVADLGKTLIKFTKMIVELYEKFEPLIKRFLKFQLYLKGFQTILVSFKQFGNALLYPISWLLGKIPMSSVTGGLPPVSGATSSAASSLPLLNRFAPGYATLLATGSPVAAAKANANYNPMNHAGNVAILKKYQAANKRFGAMNRFSGLGMLGGSVVGGLIGNNLDEDKGMMVGSLIGGGLGALAPLLVGSGPWGWIIGAAAVAITGITSSIVKYNREVAKAKSETEKYMASLRTLDIGKMDIASTDGIFNANLRITTSLLHTENEKLELQAELWRKIREEREGSQPQYDQSTSNNVIQQVLGYRDKYYSIGNIAKYTAFEDAREKLFGELYNKGLVQSYQSGDGTNARSFYTISYAGKTATYHGNRLGSSGGGVMENDYVNEIAALQAAFDPENPLVNKARIQLFSKLKRAKSVREYNDIVSGFIPSMNFPVIDENLDISKLKDKDFEAMLSDNSLMAYPEYAIPILKQLDEIVNSGQSYMRLLEIAKDFDFNAENVKLPMEETRDVLSGFTGNKIFSKEFGEFGTPEWIKNVRDYANSYYTTTDAIGNEVRVAEFEGGITGDAFNKEIQVLLEKVNEFYNSIPSELQKFYAPYIDEKYWNDIFDLSKYQDMSWHAPMAIPESVGPANITPPLKYGFSNWSYNGTGLQNEALALSSTKSSVSPNVTNNNNNNFSFTINVDTVKTDMDVDQVADFVTERVVDSLGMVSGQRYVPGFYNR